MSYLRYSLLKWSWKLVNWLNSLSKQQENPHAPTPPTIARNCCGQGVDITIPVTCSVFEVDPMTSQCTRGVPRLKFRHKIHEMWVIISFVAIASQ